MACCAGFPDRKRNGLWHPAAALDRIRIDRTHIAGSIDSVNPVYTNKLEQIHGR
jgi:hypothetical protein